MHRNRVPYSNGLEPTPRRYTGTHWTLLDVTRRQSESELTLFGLSGYRYTRTASTSANTDPAGADQARLRAATAARRRPEQSAH